MSKIWLEVHLTGNFRTVDDERLLVSFLRNRVEKLVEKYLVDNDLTQFARLNVVVGDRMEPDDDKDRIRKRGLRDTR